MKSLKNTVKELNLIYYEYDAYKKVFNFDKKGSKKEGYDELMKLTYELTKLKIDFDVTKDKSVILHQKQRSKHCISNVFKKLIDKYKKRKMQIYILNDKKVDGAKNIPLFSIKNLDVSIDFSRYDAVVFTSKNGVYALNEISTIWQDIPSYAIATTTAKAIKELNGKLAFVGKERHGNEFAHELLEHLRGKKVLYVRGKKVVSNLMGIFKENDIDFDDVVVYENSCKELKSRPNIPKGSYVVFSSPSTIECFLKHYEFSDDIIPISIGHTTAKYFPDGITPHIADVASLESCVNKAHEIEETKSSSS